jgi:hypothetical protein
MSHCPGKVTTTVSVASKCKVDKPVGNGGQCSVGLPIGVGRGGRGGANDPPLEKNL